MAWEILEIDYDDKQKKKFRNPDVLVTEIKGISEAFFEDIKDVKAESYGMRVNMAAANEHLILNTQQFDRF